MTLGLLLLWATALADPASVRVLSPSLQDLRDVTAQLVGELDAADALADAVGRGQNAWATAGRMRTPPPVCTPEVARDARVLEAMTVAWASASSASAQTAAEVGRMAAEPTVLPLLDATEARPHAVLRERALAHVRVQAEAAAWHRRFVHSLVQRCPDPGGVWAGWPATEPRARDERPRAVAVMARGPGGVCAPEQTEPVAGVVVVRGGLGCYSTAPCACEPAALAPGEVLGPTTTKEGP